MLRLVEIRYDSDGKSFMALQGQSDEEAHEANRKHKLEVDRMAARIFADHYHKRYGKVG